MTKPLVSVCIPTYNGEKYLKECLDSVIVQTFSDFEILIVDDCSSDKTLSIVKEYASGDRRIRVIRNEQNHGLVGNWNRCVELARGEWIKFVFQDDLIAPECLEKMLAARKSDSAIICCRRDFIFESGTDEHLQNFYQNIVWLENLFPQSTEISSKDFCQAILDYINKAPGFIGYNFVGEPTTLLLHQKVFHQFGKFNPHLIQICDLEFWTRIAVHTGIIYVSETLATFRLHSNATSTRNHAQYKYRIETLDQLLLLHEFALAPVYEPLRVIATRQSPPLNNLVNLLVKQARKAREKALCVNHSSLLAEWQEIVCFYPILAHIAKYSFLRVVTSYFLKKLRFLKRKLQLMKWKLIKVFQAQIQSPG